jgi:Fic family protein
MDIQRFTKRKTGQLVQIPHRFREDGKDWAFIPDELPAHWEFPVSLWPLLKTADSTLSKLDGIGETLPNPQLLLAPLQRREAISSSSIEGTHVTPEQLLLFELDPREARDGNDRVADWEEVFSYGAALRKGWAMLVGEDLPMCHRVITEMHKILMSGARGKSPGQYRTQPVQIGSGHRYIAPPPSEVQRLMDNLERYANAQAGDLDPLVKAFIIHYQFEAIHPFEDGNGRIGRALIALLIQEWLGHDFPWLYMSPYYEKNGDEYVDLLFRVSAEGAWREWIEFCLNGVIAQTNDSIQRCRAFKRIKDSFTKRVQSPTPRSDKIISILFSSPVVTVTYLASEFQVSYHTARDDAQRLVDAGILAELKGIYPKSFCAPEIMDAAYGEPMRSTTTSTEHEQPSAQSETGASSTV